jgi:hypothetical protein
VIVRRVGVGRVGCVWCVYSLVRSVNMGWVPVVILTLSFQNVPQGVLFFADLQNTSFIFHFVPNKK